MKYCGCNTCKNRGEVNPHDAFYVWENAQDKEFEKIFLNSYTVGEMTDLYEELEPKFENKSVVNRINIHVPFDAHAYWMGMSFE